MDEHKEAAELLETAPEPTKPAPDMDVPDAEKKQYEAIRLALVRERRLNGEVDVARKLMDGILGDPKKPGWGRKEIPALLENVEVLAAQGDNKTAAERANGLAQALLPNIETNPRLKEIYLQCYYLTVENVYRQAVKLKDKAPAKYAEGLKTAASLAADLAKNQLGFVNDATRDPLPRPDGRGGQPGPEDRVPGRLPDDGGGDGQAGGGRHERPEARAGVFGRGVADRGAGEAVAGLRRRRGQGPRDETADATGRSRRNTTS